MSVMCVYVYKICAHTHMNACVNTIRVNAHIKTCWCRMCVCTHTLRRFLLARSWARCLCVHQMNTSCGVFICVDIFVCVRIYIYIYIYI